MPDYTFNDGGPIPFGSRILQLSSSAGTGYGSYIAESFEVTRPMASVKRQNEIGRPVAAIYWSDWSTGTATLQLPTTSSRYPVESDRFSTSISGSAIASNYLITQVGYPESNTVDKKISIQFTEIRN